MDANVMKTEVDNDDNEYASMNDFHLAETDLIQCLMRTNILQRIRYGHELLGKSSLFFIVLCYE